MKKTKRIISVLLALIMVTGVLSVAFVSAGAATTTGITGRCNWTYDSSTKTLTISGNGPMGSYKIWDNGKQCDSPFFKKDCIKIIIKNGVTDIGRCAFYQTRFSEIEIPSSVTSINESAFRDSTFAYNVSITNGKIIKIPDSVTLIDSYAFSGCEYLYNVKLPNSITEISTYAFGNTALSSITFPSNLKKIGFGAFSNCNFKTMSIPSSVTRIDSYAFHGNKQLRTVTIPASVTSIGDYAFGYYQNTSTYLKVDGFTIKGYKNTAAQSYANNNNFFFDSLGTASSGSGSSSNTSTTTVTKPGKPTIVSVNYYSSFDGIAISWNKASNATKYQIARKKTGQSGYTYYTTNATSYTEGNITPGVKYTYQVQAFNGSTAGSYSTSKTVVTMSAPTLTLSNKSNGVRGEWNAVKGAVKYRVYYKSELDPGWSYTHTTNTYYPLLNTVPGRKYAMQIFPVGQDNIMSPHSSVVNIVYKSAGMSIKPTLTLSNKSNGIRAEWSSVSGASYYIVYYRLASVEKWSSTTTTNTYYPFLSAVSGKEYKFQVLPMFGSAKGSYSKVMGIVFTKVNKTKPTLTVSNKSNGIRGEWNAISGATSYRFFYKENGTDNWSHTDTKNTYFAFLDAEYGKKYDLQVLPLFGTEKGSYSSKLTLDYFPLTTESIGTPSITSLNYDDWWAYLKWSKVTGASGYVISKYSYENDSYEYLIVEGGSNTSYDDWRVFLGKDYYYWVKAYTQNGNSKKYGPWSTGKYLYYNL